jgi:Domain of unknown function (DUF4261)
MLTGLAYPMTHIDGDTLLVELLYEQEARLDEGQLLAGVSKVLSRTVRAGDDGQPMLLASYGHPSDPARIDLSQTWGFPQARRVLDRCQAVMTIGERSVGPFPPAQRLDAFRAAVLAVCRLTAPAAAWWPYGHSAPATAVTGWPAADGAAERRLFRVEGSNQDVVMDTLGLQVFGLPDLQCHCHDLELPRLAAYLRNAGNYVFERGDVIRNGDTIEGMLPGEKWRCLQEKALIPPGS